MPSLNVAPGEIAVGKVERKAPEFVFDMSYKRLIIDVPLQ